VMRSSVGDRLEYRCSYLFFHNSIVARATTGKQLICFVLLLYVLESGVLSDGCNARQSWI
jgi:hypothetical protein